MPNQTEEQIKTTPYSDELINIVFDEIQLYKTEEIPLSDKKTFSQDRMVQKIKTHQNKGFLTQLAPGQKDDREFFDIITPMVETGVVNIDLNEEHLEAYTDNPNHLTHEYFAKSIFKNYLRQTNQGIAINEGAYQLIDDGNLILRRLETERSLNNGEIWRPVLLQNLYVIDQSARTLEDTTVIEESILNQTDIRSMKTWSNIDKVIELCNVGKFATIPSFNAYYRYGELSKEKLGKIKEEVHGIEYKPQDGDEKTYIQTMSVIVKARKDLKKKTGISDSDKDVKGVVVFAEELKPQKIKISSSLELTCFKPYLSARLGKYNDRFLGEGYREIGIPFQNKANELGNKIQKLIRQFKIVWVSSDPSIAGKNVLSSIKDGQILQATDLQLLNNVLPDLSFLASQWNQNIQDCQQALKAFETASGETLPSGASATAVVVQDKQVGKYYNFKRQKYSLLLSQVYKRWVLPDLLKHTSNDEALELVGDASFFEDIVDAYVNGWIIDGYLKSVALTMAQDVNTPVPTQESIDQMKELKKQDLLSQPKLFGKIFEDFYKDVEVYVGIDFVGETYNKQNFISNALQVMQYELNPTLSVTPEAQDTLRAIKTKLGLPVKRKSKPSSQIQNPMAMAQPTMPTMPQNTPNPPVNENNPLNGGGGML